jgi:hypothetical protein
LWIKQLTDWIADVGDGVANSEIAEGTDDGWNVGNDTGKCVGGILGAFEGGYVGVMTGVTEGGTVGLLLTSRVGRFVGRTPCTKM